VWLKTILIRRINQRRNSDRVQQGIAEYLPLRVSLKGEANQRVSQNLESGLHCRGCRPAGGHSRQQKEKYVGTIVHDLRRCAARNFARAGVREEVAMEITGHKTWSMYRRYRIVDEKDLMEAVEKLQTHLESQDGAKLIPLRANQ